MKKLLFISVLVLLITTTVGQTRFYDATQFQIINKGPWTTENPYHRLPGYMKDSLREAHWRLATQSSGLAIRFRTDSKEISARWDVTYNTIMDHQAFVGTKGVDLYTLMDDGHWQYINVGRVKGKVSQSTIVSNLPGLEREYMLYLPLYDGVDRLEIGVDSLAMISKPTINSPQHEKPVAFYGTSITQGGCATRPGMSYTAILSRKLNRECINLGFSGNGKLDPEMARIMAGMDVSCFVLDFVPNCTFDQVKDLTQNFVAIIRAKHPRTPIIIVENAVYPFSLFDQYQAKYQPSKNAMLAQRYQEMVAAGDKNLYYVTSENLIGDDQEGTVDSIHFTDLGFLRFSDKLYPVIKQFLNEKI